MTNIHVVMRPINTAGGLIPSGTRVDTATWRNAGKLVAQRYLREATPEEAAKFVTEPEKPAAKKKGAKNGN